MNAGDSRDYRGLQTGTQYGVGSASASIRAERPTVRPSFPDIQEVKAMRLFRASTVAHAHCDLPCVVYDPAQARIEA